jgi:HK97 family phage prohead protease
MSDDIEIIEDDLVPNFLKAYCATTVKAVNKDTREVAHLITTANPDRVGDVVDAKGADLANYLRHPVVMANHSYQIQDIIGRAVSLTVGDDGIFARTKYRDTPLGKDAFNLAAEGLGAWSIGFRPTKYKAMKDDKGQTKGFHFTEWEMLEYSQVAIPMNPDAVQNAIQRGWVSQENLKTFFRIESAEPPKEASDRTNAEPIDRKHQPRSSLTDRQRRELARIERIITGCRLREEFGSLGV